MDQTISLTIPRAQYKRLIAGGAATIAAWRVIRTFYCYSLGMYVPLRGVYT